LFALDPVVADQIFPGQARFSFYFLVCAGAHAAGFSCFGLPRQFQCWFSFRCCRMDLSAQHSFSALARGRSDLRWQFFWCLNPPGFPLHLLITAPFSSGGLVPCAPADFLAAEEKFESCRARYRSVLHSSIVREQDFPVRSSSVSC
jgi:hypothetical protein